MLLSDARKMHVPRLLLHLSDVKNSLVGPNATTLKKTQFSAGVGLSGGDTGRVAESGNGLNWITRPSRGPGRCHTCRHNTGDVHSTANCSDSTVWRCTASVTVYAKGLFFIIICRSPLLVFVLLF